MKKRVNLVIVITIICALASMLQTRDKTMKIKETMAAGKEGIQVEEKYSVEKTQEKTPNAGTRKIALTFDDDVIIGLSQEISYERSGFDDLVLFSLF